MTMIAELLPAGSVFFVILISMLAGLVKGVVGFAMPMILISGLGSVVAPEVALAGLILPTLLTNGWQALRQGRRAAWDSVSKFRVFLISGLVLLLASAQLVRVLPQGVMLLMIGGPILLYAGSALAGWPLRLPRNAGRRWEAAIGAVAGFFGGISGVWGPPTVAMLTARETDKGEQMRVQGVIYGLGALALLGAHVASGVLRAETLPFSIFLCFPAFAGMAVGLWIQDRVDQRSFRLLTLLVLLLAACNLVRRGILAL
ncbi:sulfite exporter TauE/SafE family protein [Roseovarius sp. TE539]|uniref:sulfite exporter TauE/SafE family protein n=1 Tax=Roseovarius sp. TE539 TaxID=2249812 RepID=UPI000DDD9ECA|nr:sulfite exporter TauE/SafE family protein [Roseovarius sp. TE539]RBI71517.1 sulfite exporter TauE/SafE family protein [Roseovarius sp. TE539]